MMCVKSCPRGSRERSGNFCVIESGRACALGGIDKNKFGAVTGGKRVGEALVGKPVDTAASTSTAADHAGDERRGVVAHEFFRASVVGGGQDALLSASWRGENYCRADYRDSRCGEFSCCSLKVLRHYFPPEIIVRGCERRRAIVGALVN